MTFNYKSEFLYAFMYLDTELQRRLLNNIAALLKVCVVFSERMSSCTQGTNNTARDLGFSDSNITKTDFQWSKQITGE